MNDRDNTYSMSEVRYNFNSGSPDLFTWSGGAITSHDYNRVYAVLANDRLQQIPALHLRTTNTVAGAGQPGTLLVQVDGFRSTLRTGAVTLYDHYQVFVESGSFGTGSTTGLQFGAGAGAGGLDNQGLFDFSKVGDGVLTLGDISATFTGARTLSVGEGALRVTHAGSLGAAGVTASIEQGGALELAVAGWSPTATLVQQSGSFERWAVDGARAGDYVLPAGVHLQIMRSQTGGETITLNGGSVMGYIPRDWDHVAVIQKLGAGITLRLAADSYLGQPYASSSNGVWDLSRLYDQGKLNQSNASNPNDPGIRGSYFQIDGAITGPGGLTKVGQDVILLAGASTYQGLTRVENGVLQIGRADALPVTTGLVLATASGVFDLNGYDQRVASLSGAAGSVTNSAFALNTLTVRQAAATTLTGTLNGNLVLRKEGAGTLTLAPVDAMGVATTGNAYRGGTILAGGLVSVAMDAALGGVPSAFDADNLNFVGGGLQATASFALSARRGLTIGAAGGSLDVPAGVTLTVPAAVTAAGALAKTGPGTVRLDGVSSLGALTVSAGTLELAAGSASGALAGAGSLTKVGAGTFSLAGSAAGFTGVTAVSAGLLTVASGDALGGLGTAGRWSVASGATLAFGAATTEADVTSALASGNFAAGSFLGFDTAAGDRTFSAALAGSQGVATSGAGTLTLAGVGTFTGGLRLVGGTLAFASGASGDGAVTFVADSSLRWSGVNTTDLSARLAAVPTGVVATLDVGANDVSFASGLAGTGVWRKTGSGVLTLSAASAHAGSVDVAAGTLRLGVASALPSVVSLAVASGATLDLDGNALTLSRLAGLGAVTSASTATLTVGDAAASGVGSLGGSLGLIKQGAGALTVTGVADYSGSTTISAGRLVLSSGSLAGAIDGAGTLVKQGPGILTLSGQGSYAGGLEILGGTLRLAAADAASTPSVRFGDATVQSLGGDRAFGGTVRFLDNATQTLTGDGSITFSAPVILSGDVLDLTLRNLVDAGKSVTFAAGLTAAELAHPGTWSIDGAGATTIQGAFTAAGAFGVSLVKGGDGTLTFAPSAGSTFNQGGSPIIVRRGVFALGADEVIPHGAGAGGLVLAAEAFSADSATFDLAGRSETITGLTAVTNGVILIDNSGASAATLTVGAGGATVNYGGGAGTYAITDSGAGALSFAKTGAGAAVVADGVTLSYRGATSVTGGSLTLRSPLTASTSLSVTGNGSVLALAGGHSAPAVVTSVTVGAGSTLSLADGAGAAFTALSSLQLGSASGANSILELNVGDLSAAGDALRTDVLGLATGGALGLFAGNKVTFNLVDAGLSENQTYTLVSSADGGLTTGALGAGDWLLGATPGGFASLTLAAADGAVTLTTGALVAGDLYWQGASGSNWSAALASWSTDLGGASASTVLPGQGSAVRFQRDSAAAAAITTNLDRPYRVRSLTFAAGTSAGVTPSSVTLTNGGGRLDLFPASATEGITLAAGASASVVLAAPIQLGAAQTWTVTDATANLNVSGSLTGAASLTKAGLGRMTLTGVAAAEFNPAGTSTLTVSAGTLIQSNPWALGREEDRNLMKVVVGNGAAYYAADATTLTIPTPVELAGGTLSVATANQVYAGALTVSANSSVNLRDANAGTTVTTTRQIDLLGPITGAGRLTLNSSTSVGGGNQIGGNFRLVGNNSAWTGGMLINNGTVIAAQASALGSGTLEMVLGKVAWQGQNGESWTSSNGVSLPAAAVAELNVDNISASVTDGFAVTLTGPVSLGAGSALRGFMSDGNLSVLTLAGDVALGGAVSISAAGGAGGLLTMSGAITGGAGGAFMVNDDQGGWAQTNRDVMLTGANTFSGNITVAGGELLFATVSDAGAANSLGTGNQVTLIGGGLGFAGSVAQSTSRLVSLNGGTGLLAARGTGGAAITFAGAVQLTGLNTTGIKLTLHGLPGSAGALTGGVAFTDTIGTTADMAVDGGAWSLSGATVNVPDDLFVRNTGTVLRLASTGVLAFGASADSSIDVRSGARVILEANDPATSATLDRLFLGQAADGDKVILDMQGFTMSAARLILGERSLTRVADILGTGLLTVTGGDIDLHRGTIFAPLGSTGSTSLDKWGPGLVTLAGDNRGLASTGDSVVGEGTLRLDYSADNNVKLRAASKLNLQGGNLELLGNASASTTQGVGEFTLAGGWQSRLSLTPGSGQTLTLAAAAFARAAGQGTLRYEYAPGASLTTTTVNAAHGLLGATAFATVKSEGVTSFARVEAGAVVGLASTVANDAAAWAAGVHVTDAGAGFTGAANTLSLGSLRFDAATGSVLNQLSGSTLTLASGGLLVTDRVTAGAPALSGGFLLSSTNELIVFQDSAQTFEIASGIAAGQTLTKTGNGVLRLSGRNDATALVLQGGTIELAGGRAISDTAALVFSDRANTRLRILQSETIGTVSGGRAGTESHYGVIEIAAGATLSVRQTASPAAYSGTFTGNGVLRLAGTHNLNLNAVSLDFLGTVISAGGLFQLSGNGRIGASSIEILRGGSVLLDNNSATRSSDRLFDTASIVLNSADGTWGGGSQVRGLSLRTNEAAATNETIGSLVFGSGSNYMTGWANNAGTATSYETSLIATAFERRNRATVTVIGRGLGLASNANGRNNFRIGDAAAQTAFMASAQFGAGGAAGSPTMSIVPWAVGEALTTTDIVAANMGNSLVTYVSGSGFRPLVHGTEYATYAAGVATANIREALTANLTGLAGRTLNALVVHNGNTAASTLAVTGTGAGQTLVNTSGAFLFTLNPAATASSAHAVNLGGFDVGIGLGSAASEYVFSVVNPTYAANTPTLAVTVSSPLTSQGALVKSGRGTLILSGANNAGGGLFPTVLNEGTLEIASLSAIGGDAGELIFAGGALRLPAGFAQSVINRPVSIHSGGATIENATNLTLTRGLGAGVGGFTKRGNGVLTLGAAASYQGPTAILAGSVVAMALGAIPDGTFLSLGAGTSAASVDFGDWDVMLSGLEARANSNTASVVTVAPGRTLRINGDLNLTTATSGGASLLTMTGGGALAVQADEVYLADVGSGAVNTTLDLTGLAAVDLDAAFRIVIARRGDNRSTARSILRLSDGANTLTTGQLLVGASAAGAGTAASPQQTLFLGAGTNVIRADEVRLGVADRDSGLISFAGASGTVTFRDRTGTGRANFTLGPTRAFATAYTSNNVIDLSGHEADVAIGTYATSLVARTAVNTNDLLFSAGTLDILNLNMAFAKGAGAALNRINISGGTVKLGGSVAFGDAGTGSLVLATAAEGQLNITGGAVDVGAGLRRAGAGVASVTLNGGVLDLNGFAVGDATYAVTFNAQAGTLRDVGTLNGAGGLTKSTAGTLTLEGSAAYTGVATVSEGTLVMANTSSAAAGVTINGGTNTTVQVTSVAAAGTGVFDVRNGATTPTIRLTIDGGGTIALPNGLVGNSTITTTIHVDNNGSGADGVIQLNGDGFGGTGGYGNATLNVTGGNGYSLYIANLYNFAGGLGTMTFNPTTAALELGNLSVLRASGTGTFALGGTHVGSKVSGVIADGSGANVGGLAAVSKTGTGTWTLTGANTYTGATSVSAGILDAAAGALAGTSALNVTGGTLTVVDFGATPAITVGAAGTAVISGTGLTAGAVLVNNSTDDALHFSGATGAVTLASLGGTGKARFASNLTVGTVTGGTTTVAGVADITTLTTGTLTLNGATASIGTLNGGTVALGSATALTANDGTFGGIISGATGTLTKATAGTLILSGANTFGGAITISAGKLQIGAGSTTGSIGAGDIANAGILEINRSDALSFANVVSGAGSLVKNGTGALTLTGNNTFDGGFTINGGTGNVGKVIAGHNNSLGVGTVTLANQAATLELANGITVANAMTVAASGNFKIIQLQSGAAAATYSGNITNNEDVSANFDLIAGVDGTLTVSGNISGGHVNAGIEKLGAGTVILSGANTYTGATTISAGTLSAAAGALAGTSGITVNGAIFAAADYNPAATLALDASATATISAADLIITGAISNAGSAADALDFSAATGKITLSSLTGAGKTRFASDADVTGGISVGTVTVVGALGANITGGTVSAASLTAASVTGGTTTITGAATVTTVNGGATTVGGVADITTLTSGTLTFDGASGSIGTLTDGTFNLNGAAATVGTLSAGTINLAASTELTVNEGTFSGSLLGSGSLIKATSGILTLTGPNLSFSGATTISIGELIIQSTTSLGTGAVTVASGATLNLNSLGVSNAITVLAGGIIENGPTTASAEVVAALTGTNSIDTVLTGAGGLEKTDGGQLTLSTPNFFTGAVEANVAGAVIKAAFLDDASSSLGASTLTDPANLVLGSGATLEFTGGSNAVTTRSFTIGGSATIAASGAGSLEFTSASNFATTGAEPALSLSAGAGLVNRFAASLADGSDPLANLLIDGTGTWVLGGSANRFKGDVRVDVGAGATLGFEAGALGSGATYAQSVIEVANGSRLAWSGTNTDDISSRLSIPAGATAKLDLGSNNVTFATVPTLGSGASLQKEGSGTLNISAAFSAPTLNVAVSSGTLAVNGVLGDITLASGARLGGTGTLGTATVGTGAILAPGNSPGTLNATDLVLTGGSVFEWEVQDATSSTGYDKINLTGNLDLTGANPGSKVSFKIISRLGAGDGNTAGDPLNFGPPDGTSSIRTFNFGVVGGVLLNSGQNISDVFEFDLTEFTYSDGSASSAGLWSIAWDGGSAITLTAVPEPSTYGFGLGALALAAAAIRRRRKQQAA